MKKKLTQMYDEKNSRPNKVYTHFRASSHPAPPAPPIYAFTLNIPSKSHALDPRPC